MSEKKVLELKKQPMSGQPEPEAPDVHVPTAPELPKIDAGATKTKAILEELGSNPSITKKYKIAESLDVTFKSYTAFEHRLYLAWLSKSMPENIRILTRREFELGLRNLSLYIHKLGEESLSAGKLSDLYPSWCLPEGGTTLETIKKAAFDILDNKLAALTTKNDVATSLLSIQAKKFYNDCLDVTYNEGDNKHFGDISLESLLFDSDQVIKASLHGKYSIEFTILSNKTISMIERWMDSETYVSRAEFDYLRAVKYLAATIRSINGKPLAGERGPRKQDETDEQFLLDIYERRFKGLMGFPHQIIVLLDTCRTHLARTMQDKVKDLGGGLKN